MNILLNGASGRLGRCLEAIIADDPDLAVTGRGDRGTPLPVDADADVIIDFSHPDALGDALDLALRRGLPVVSGTTGLTTDQFGRIRAASVEVPICHAANFAVGIHVLTSLVREAAARLGGDFDLELVEAHHRSKIDAPSGTAWVLAEAAADARGVALADVVRGDGHAGAARRPGTIGIQSLRGGDVVGEHTVHFFGDGERLALTHRATDRSLFARGALRAARWLVDQPPGLYGLDDVISG